MKELLKKFLVRIQNVKVFVAIVSGVLLILANTGVITFDHANHISDILNTVLTILVGLGVLGNPESHVSLNKFDVVKDLEQVVLQPSQPAPVQPSPVQVTQTQPIVAAPNQVNLQPVQTPVQVQTAPVQAPVQQ